MSMRFALLLREAVPEFEPWHRGSGPKSNPTTVITFPATAQVPQDLRMPPAKRRVRKAVVPRGRPRYAVPATKTVPAKCRRSSTGR